MIGNSHSAAPSAGSKVNGDAHAPVRGTVQEKLKSIGQRVASLQEQLSTAALSHLTSESPAVAEAWLLLVELRPFLFIACDRHCAHTLASSPVAVAFRTHESKRDLHHVGLALRLYNTLVRMTIGVPHAALHACLVLLSLLPQLSTNFLVSGSDGERYMDGLRHHLLCLAAVDAVSFAHLINELLTAVLPVAAYSTTRRAGVPRDTVVSVRSCPLTRAQLEQRATGLSFASAEQVEDLFEAEIVLSSAQEADTTALALASLLTHLVREGALTSGVLSNGSSGDPAALASLLELAEALIGAGTATGLHKSPLTGQKRWRDEENAHSQRCGGGGATPGTDMDDHLRVGLDLLRALTETRLVQPTVHGISVLRALLLLCSPTDHQAPSCSLSTCTLDAASFALDFLEDTANEQGGAGKPHWSSSLFHPADTAQRGSRDGPLVTQWCRTLLDQHTHLAAASSPNSTVGDNHSGDDAGPPHCVENVYRLQRLLQTSLSVASDVSPAHTTALMQQVGTTLGNAREGFLLDCLRRRSLPLLWYETDEHLDGAQCPEHEWWTLLPFEAFELSALVSALSQLKETLSACEFERARAHAYAIVGLAFRRHAQAVTDGGEDDAQDLSDWLQERRPDDSSPPPSATTEPSELLVFSTLVEDSVQALLHAPEPQLPALLSALTLSLRVARLIERRDVVEAGALCILQAVDEYLTRHKNGLAQASPMLWRVLLRMVCWHLPMPLSAVVPSAPAADDPSVQEDTVHSSAVRSRSSGVLRHILVLLQRFAPLHPHAWQACVSGLTRGLALRTTHTLTRLAEVTSLSLAALHHQAAAGLRAVGDQTRVTRARRELQRDAGALAVLLQDAQPMLAFIVRHLHPGSESTQSAGVSRVNSGALVNGQLAKEHRPSTEAAVGAAAAALALSDGTVSFLLALSGAVQLAREWVVQAPSTRPLFHAPALSESVGSVVAAAAASATVVDVDDDDEDEDNDTGAHSDADLAVAEVDAHRPHAADKDDMLAIGTFPTFLTVVASEGIAASFASFSSQVDEEAEQLRTEDTLAHQILACLALLAPDDEASDAHLVSKAAVSAANDEDGLLSLNALALSTILQQRAHRGKTHAATVAVTLQLLNHPPTTEQEATEERQKLRVIERVYSGAVAAATASGRQMKALAPKASAATVLLHGDALVDCLSLLSQPTRQRSLAWELWAEALLHACAVAWPSPELPLPPLMDLRGPLLDVAGAVLRSLAWRPEDLLRHAPHMITGDFFAQLCHRVPGASPALSLRTAMDLVAPKLIFHADWDLPEVEHAVAQLESIADGPVANACLEPALAHVLLQHGSSSPARAMDSLTRLFQYLQLPVSDLPRITTSCVPLTVLHLLSVTGDAQLRAWSHQEHASSSGNGVTAGNAVESVSFTFLELALRQLITLTESASTEAGVEAALAAPVPAQVASQSMVTHGFDVLDRLMKCMGVTLTQSTVESPVPQLQMSSVVSVHTGCRWLLALASFLRFLGPHTTLMMAKLPPILETCCTEAPLVRVACAVWWEMVQQCTDDYLHKHAATIVVDLVGLELYAAAMDDVALAMLSRAIERVYSKSAESPFWQSYFKVLGGLSRLVAGVQPPVPADEAKVGANTPTRRGGRASGKGGRQSARKDTSPTKPKPGSGADTGATADAASSADSIASGFSFIMNSSSSKCKAIFVRALHRFLSEADATTLHEVTRAATTHPQLIPTLLQCSRELDAADVLDALSCVGMIGAVAPQTVSLSTSAAAAQALAQASAPRTAGGESDQPHGPPSPPVARLQIGTVLQWRQLAFVLLSEYCTRALANTSDPAIYDRAGYAVQELLLLFARRERTAANGPPLLKGDVLHVDELGRYTWWHNLDKHSKQLLEGFTTTRYAAHRHTPSEPTYPAYHAGMPYAHWLHAFFKSLAPKCDAKFAQMMAALRNVSRRDLGLVTFLIPHMIANILENALDGSAESAAAVEVVLGEIDAVLRAAVHGAEHGQDDVLSLRSQNALETNPPVPQRTDSATPRVDEHVQFILSTLEDLQQVRWSLLRVGRRLEPPPTKEANKEEMYLKLADQYRDFLERTPASQKALAAIEIGSNMRALRCLESQGRLHAVAVESKDVPLQRIFAALGDRDSAKSIHRLMHGLLPEKAAFSYENSGEWQQAIQNCELVLQHKPRSVAHQFTALRCMRQLGQLHFMSRYAQSLLEEAKQVFAEACGHSRSTARGTERPPSSPRLLAPGTSHLADSVVTLQNYANEAAWRLGEWDKVQRMDALPASLAPPVAQWVKLLHGKAPAESVARATHAQRSKLTPIIQRTCRENYSQCYPYVAMLHTLADLDAVSKLVQSDGAWSEQTQRVLIDSLHARLQVTDVSLEAREPMLSLHRAIFGALGLQAEVSTTWLENAKLLRDAGFPEAALIAARQSFLAVPSGHASSYYTLAAELLYEMNAPMQAVEFVSEHVSNTHLPATLRSDLQVMMTNWRLETGSQSKDEVIGSYRAALGYCETERGHHHLAVFLDKLYMVNVDSVETEMKGIRDTDKVSLDVYAVKLLQLIEDYAMPAVSEYARALLEGHDTVSVSLPRLLTLWLDGAVALSEVKRTSPRSAVDADRLLKSLNQLVEVFLFDKARSVPPHILVTALPQLLSRLCHPCPQVVTIITRAVVRLMTYFPQPCLWMVMPIAFSKQVRRMNVVKQNIIPPFVAAHPSHKQILEHVFEIFVALIELCNCPATTFANNAKLTAQPFIQKVAPVLQSARIIVPTMANLSPHITATELSEVFPSSPTFLRFADRVDVMSSLQKPKRVWVETNEGTTVSFLCKSKDEPRKDIRMMEVASLMNTFFLKDPAARRRNFGLRRYAIAALTDDCALIEWVNNISTLRNVVTQCYGLDGSGVRISQVKAWQAKVENKTLTKLDMFKKHILPAAPPVLHQWFDATFPTNDQWYQARNLFTQSTALWSIAGHIVGLGDRHGENLMIDMQGGEMLHVDFACLFDKGETLDVPERVRFRLTQNLVDGMGVLGTEGLFRANCEIALRCQMQNKNAVMSVVETLLHDPLVEWIQKSGRPTVNPNRLIQRVARRLDGFLDLYTVPPEKDTMALNVEGQVSKLISHSSAVENLCEMYIWWMAWL